jgi:hypothetical protein
MFCFHLYLTLAHRRRIFTADITTYYCHTLEEALKRAKAAGKRPGCHYGGIVLKSGKRGLAIYREGTVIEPYSALGRKGQKEKLIIITTWAVVESVNPTAKDIGPVRQEAGDGIEYYYALL